MSAASFVIRKLQHAASGGWGKSGKPYDASVPFHPPRGRYAAVHYGLMFPGLPAPLNFLDIITVVGQPRMKLWANPHLVTTTPRDTANVLVGSGVTFENQFRGYSIAKDVEIADDSSLIRFGDDLEITGNHPDFTVAYNNPEFKINLQVRATDKNAFFVNLRGGLYDHWSMLCEHTGTISHAGTTYEINGLNTLEYARGVDLALPMQFFTYQIINIDERTQVLMAEGLGPAGLPLYQAVHLRSLDDHGAMYEDGFAFEVFETEDQPRTTPNGITVKLGTRFAWSVNDRDGNQLISIEGATNDDYVYGMAGGYAGSYKYTGRFRGEDVGGTGYIEYIGDRSRR